MCAALSVIVDVWEGLNVRLTRHGHMVRPNFDGHDISQDDGFYKARFLPPGLKARLKARKRGRHGK
jgi:hypothetical protein